MARVWVYGDHISTDDIIAGRYLAKHDVREWGKHTMENIDPGFTKRVKPGDVVIAGKDFGCGSSREQAPIALKAAGVSAVIAESFARIFYRNSINQGLPVLTCPGIRRHFKNGARAHINPEKGIVKNLSTGKVFKVEPLPEFVMEILKAGGLVLYLRSKLRK